MMHSEKQFPAHARGFARLAENVFYEILRSPRCWDLLPYFGSIHVFLRPEFKKLRKSNNASSTSSPHLTRATIHKSPFDVAYLDFGLRRFEQEMSKHLLENFQKQNLSSVVLTFGQQSLPMTRQPHFDLEFDLPQELRAETASRFQEIFEKDSSDLQTIFEKANVHLLPPGELKLSQVAHIKALWQHWRSQVHFRFALGRVNWSGVAGVILADCFLHRRIPTATFQHSVVGSWLSYVPPLAETLFTFGTHSSELLRSIQEEVRNTFDLPFPCHSFLPLGNYLEQLSPISPDQKASRLLVFDQFSTWGREYFGISQDLDSLQNIVTTACRSETFSKIIIRLHPDWSDAREYWKAIAREFPQKIEFSDSATTDLQTDIARASLGVGIFSTAVVLAMNAGLPCFLVSSDGKCVTPDLSGLFAFAGTAADRFTTDAAECLGDDANYERRRKKIAQHCSAYFEPQQNRDWGSVVSAHVTSRLRSAEDIVTFPHLPC